MIDISDKSVLTGYLMNRGIIDETTPYSIKYCMGGVSGTVAFVTTGDQELIVKQALAKLKVKEDWLCDPKRMYVEQLSNIIYNKYVPENVPAVLFYDSENYIYGRVAAPESCTMWKSDLMEGLLDFRVARKSMESLVIVHNKCSNDEEVAREFADKKVFYDLRISPYIEFTVSKHPEFKELGNHLSKVLMEEAVTLVHGDYSPKNIMVDGSKIFILDFEVANFGHPIFDLAFFSNHFILKSVKFRNMNAAYISMLSFMLDIYFKGMEYAPASYLEDDFIPLLGMLMLARVDGKSPVEYLVDEGDKELVRVIAARLMTSGIKNYKEALALVLAMENEDR